MSSISVWMRADITFKHLEDSTTQTISVTNRAALDETEYRLPLLTSISGLGITVGQRGSPAASAGSISIRDGYESYGEELRVSDLLRDYTPIEQSVSVYVTQTTVTSRFPIWSQIWGGKCVSWDKSFDGDEDTLTFQVESNTIEDGYRTRRIDPSEGAMPEGSTGKVLPIIFGESLYVPAYAGEAISDYEHKYYYATSLGRSFPSGDIQRYYARGDDDKYRLVWSKTKTTYWGAGTGVTTGANYSAPQGVTEQLVRARLGTVLDYGIVIGGRFRFKGQNNGALSPSGEIRFGLYEADPHYSAAVGGYRPKNDPVRTATVDKSSFYTQLRGASDFWIEFRWDRPYVFGDAPPSDSIYTYVRQSPPLFIGMVLSTYSGAGLDFEPGGISTTTGEYWYRVGTSGMSGEVTRTRPLAELLNLEFNELGPSSPDENGLSAVSFSVEIETEPTGSANLDLSDLDFILEVDGLQDNSSGAITGVANQLITYPHHAIALLSRRWDGSAWIATADWDHTAFSSRYSTVFASTYKWRRSLAGYSAGDSSLEELISDISEEMAGYLVQRTNGKLAWWPWGVEEVAAVKAFTDADIRILSMQTLSATSVINKVSVTYGRGALNADPKGVFAENEIPNFEGQVNWYSGANTYASFLAEQSTDIYGTRELGERRANWLLDATSAESYADFLLRTYDHPHKLVRFEVPFYENYSLELLDIVEILSAALPARKGTAPKARFPTYNGTEVDPIGGNVWRRAQRYRAQIISREINFQQGERPTLILECRLIKPYHPNDPS